MKKITAALLLTLTIGTIEAVDLASLQFIDTLLALSGPSAPVFFEDGVIFTAPSSYRRVGISFAHEGYSVVHWYQRLMLPEDPAIIAAGGKNASSFRDGGIMFYVEIMPDNLRNMDYRVVIDGLWTTDPYNPMTVSSPAGIVFSRVILPPSPLIVPIERQNTANGILFSYSAPPGEIITIGGSFNRWDPFMYELAETGPGLYTLNLPLPRGIHQYVFFHRGERLADPNNNRKAYTPDGKAVSEVEVY